MKVHTVFQDNRTGKPDARRHNQMSAAKFFQRLHCSGKCCGIERYPVRNSTKITEQHGVVGNLRYLRFGQCHRQILIVARVITGMHWNHGTSGQKKYCQNRQYHRIPYFSFLRRAGHLINSQHLSYFRVVIFERPCKCKALIFNHFHGTSAVRAQPMDEQNARSTAAQCPGIIIWWLPMGAVRK